ncbi:MAG: alpha/beta-type small acid-soluble spore protein [Clostridia bacterium]|nr:alpha/beta-type small acid-soluble spore protein [Clostridia bacterium]
MPGNNRKAAPNSAWTNFKMECAQEIGHLQYTKENNDHNKGDLPSRQNGQEGGPIGGQMVKKMIEMAKTQIPQS